MLRRLLHRTTSAPNPKSPRSKVKSGEKNGTQISERAISEDAFSEAAPHLATRPLSASALQPPVSASPGMAANAKHAAAAWPIELDAQQALMTARMALGECAAQAVRFVIGHSGYRQTADATFVYKHDGPIEVPSSKRTLTPRNGRDPLRAAEVLRKLPQVRKAQSDYDKVAADLKDYAEQVKNLEKRSFGARMLRPSHKSAIQDAESQRYVPAEELISGQQQKLSELLLDVNALMQDPIQKQQAVDTANEGNARWKIDGFVQLHRRLQKMADDLGQAPGAKLAQWHADLAEYRQFLTQLEAHYADNGLVRGDV